MKILFTGGGTLGSVSPLLAVYEELFARGAITSPEALWIGTRFGPERGAVVSAGIHFTPIFSGKIRRYIHWKNFIDPLMILVGLVQALFLIVKFHPDVMLNAGSYVGLPVVFASKFLYVPIVVLQLDCEPTRSNIVSASFAKRIGVAFPEMTRFFPEMKTSVVGIPVRAFVKEHIFPQQNVPTILITGGGTGAKALNELVLQSITQLTAVAEVIHITGKNKEGASAAAAVQNTRYHPRAYADGAKMLAMLASADVVVTRAGMGTLAELSALGKPTIIIPIPHSHQEKNAVYFKRRAAAVILNQEELTAETFARAILDVLNDEKLKVVLRRRISILFPQDSASRVADIIQKVVNVHHA